MLRLRPGVNVEITSSQLEAGYAQSNLIRFRNGLAEKLGGWEKFYSFAVGGTPKALHAWLDINDNEYLGVGTTTILGAITNSTLTTLTPQIYTSDIIPNFTTTSGSANVTVTDANVATVTTFDSVELRTPISVGGLILSGVYPVNLFLGAGQYRIVASGLATSTQTTATITGITVASPGVVTTAANHGFATGQLVYIDSVVGMTQVNKRLFTVTVVSPTTFQIVDTSTYTAYSSAGIASPSSVPFFTTAAGSANVTVTMQAHGLSVGSTIVFPISTTVCKSVVTITNASPGVVTWFTGSHGMSGGETIVFTTTGTLPTGLTAGTTYYVLAAGITATTFRVSATSGGAAINTSSAGSGIHTGTVGSVAIQGTYAATSITDVNNFVIAISSVPAANSVDPMNGGLAEYKYYIALGPVTAGTGYGIGTYGSGGYGTGATGSALTGTPITADNWTLDNWGQTFLATPEGGGLYAWTPGTGFQNAQLVAGAPLFNNGMFVSMQVQMAIMYGSTDEQTVGIEQNPLLVKWSAQGDYTDFTISTTSQAGSRQLPQGSKIVGGMSVPGQELLWTDLDLWSMTYLGSLAAGVWGFTKIGSNCGLIGKHAACRQGSAVYWMSASNFWVTGNGQPAVVVCSVWDTVFQDLNTTYQDKCWAWSNTPYNEIWFFYPRASTSATEPDAFVKYNIRENVWDYGALDRTAGIDQSILGMPISATSGGIIYEHETSPNADGQPLIVTFTTGKYHLSEGQDISFIDWWLPDMIWRLFNGSGSASIQITIYSQYYQSDTPTTYGPYTITNATNYFNPRIRGRFVWFTVSSSDLDSWWRFGSSAVRLAPDGRL